MPGKPLLTRPDQGHPIMIPYSWFPRWPAGFTMVIGMTLFLWGCGNVPREYVRMAEPGTTLTALTLHPEMYQGKVVLLGGTIIQEEEHEQSLWLRVKNRPLDQDYIPHRPADTNGPEAGFYWVVVANQKFPPQYRQWARMTVVGKVTDMQRFETEPVLSLLYVRGWGISSAHDGFWQSLDLNYIPSVPKSIYRN